VPSSPFTLAVCVELVLRDLPLADRIRHVHDLGFAAEIWDWTTKDLDELAGLAEAGVRFTSMTGYVDGALVDPHGAEALLASAARSIEASRRLGAPNLNLHGTGLDGDGLPVRPVEVVTGPMWVSAFETLAQVAELGERPTTHVLLGHTAEGNRRHNVVASLPGRWYESERSPLQQQMPWRRELRNRKQRLELTWIGKDERPRLDPRILLEDPESATKWCKSRWGLNENTGPGYM
jgi:hypothetical protein